MASAKPYKVYFESGALKEFEKLDRSDRDAFASPVKQLKNEPHHNADVVRNVKSDLTMYKRRVGDYRIFFVVDPKRRQVVVLALRKRDSDTYAPKELAKISDLYKGPKAKN